MAKYQRTEVLGYYSERFQIEPIASEKVEIYGESGDGKTIIDFKSKGECLAVDCPIARKGKGCSRKVHLGISERTGNLIFTPIEK